MSDEQAPPKKEESAGGVPAWVMTFADLMTLLMCFFVLLLSFSEMDLQKFKQIAGSMKQAFGVQKQIKASEMPKGTSVIAMEFSPGRPTPTPINEIRQNTIDETKQTLEFTDAVTEDNAVKDNADAGQQDNSSETAPIQKHSQEHESEQDYEAGPDNGEADALADADKGNKTEQLEVEKQQIADKEELAETDNKNKTEQPEVKKQQIADKEELAEADNTDKAEEPSNEQTGIDAQKLLQALAPEIEQGIVSLETQGDRIMIRIREKGSFPSGSSIVKGSFLPVLNKLRKSLNTIEGRIIVAGHTDDVPIKTARFRSNWELSASRAVTVVHELLEKSTLPPERFVVEGHGEAHPLFANTTPENRALNRRVEITIVQGEAKDKIDRQSGKDVLQDNPFKRIDDIRKSMTSDAGTDKQGMIDVKTLTDRLKSISDGTNAEN